MPKLVLQLVMTDNDNDGTLVIMGNILFENKYQYTFALLRKWNSLSFKRSGRHMLWIQFAAKATVIVATLALALAAAFKGDYDSLTPVVIGVAGSIMLVALPALLTIRQYNGFLQIQAQPQAQLFNTIRFGDRVEVICGNTVTTYLYEQIPYVDENDSHFCLWVNGARFIVVYKNAFETGDAESFRAFILDKCSESRLLLTKGQFNRAMLKKHLALIILLAVAFLLLVPISVLIASVQILSAIV